jgi:hypothetical protein
MVSFKNRLVKNLEIDGVNYSDYPDFCDAYFCNAEWENGTPLTNSELEELTEERGDVVNAMAFDNTHSAAEDRYDCMMDR